jgi:hypothetical protein
MAKDDDDDKPSWNVLLLIGTIAGVALGAMLVLLFRKQQQQQLSGGGQPINIWNMGPGAQGMMPQAQQAMLPAPSEPLLGTTPELSMDTRLKTVQLHTSSMSRLWYASGKNPWRVAVRVVGPPGSFAYISTDRSTLNPGFTTHPNVIAIPAGQTNEIRLQPGQDLFGLANTGAVGGSPGPRQVMASIIASEDPFPPTFS